MESRRQRPGGPRSIAAGLAALGVLLGLLGMHVLGLHGVQHEVVPVVPGSSSSHQHDSESAGTVHSHTSASESSEATAGCCDHSDGMDALMVCVALIVAVGALAGAVRSERAAAPAARLRPRSDRPPSGPKARAGPTYVLAYAVVRC